MSIKVKFGKQILRVIAANYTLRALFVFANWIKRLVKWDVSAQAGSWLALRAFGNDQPPKLAEKWCSVLFLPHVSQVNQCHEEWLPLWILSVPGRPDYIWDPYEDLKQTALVYFNPAPSRNWKLRTVFLLTGGAMKVVHLLLIMAERKFTQPSFQFICWRSPKGVTVFPDHKAIHSITSLELVNYLNNSKPGAAGNI